MTGLQREPEGKPERDRGENECDQADDERQQADEEVDVVEVLHLRIT